MLALIFIFYFCILTLFYTQYFINRLFGSFSTQEKDQPPILIQCSFYRLLIINY
jgi:hypothetical protein